MHQPEFGLAGTITLYNVGWAHEFADVWKIVVDCRDCERLMALRIVVYRYCVPVLLCRLLLATERCTSLTTDRRHVWTDGLDSVTHCDDSCHVIIGISRFSWHELAKTTMAPAARETEPTRDRRPAGRFICALQYNKLKVLSETKSTSTFIGHSCEHYIGIFR
jgi:hypothetical protein